jgi:hypothetical protein
LKRTKECCLVLYGVARHDSKIRRVEITIVAWHLKRATHNVLRLRTPRCEQRVDWWVEQQINQLSLGVQNHEI